MTCSRDSSLPLTSMLGEFGVHFEEGDDATALRLTAAGACVLLPRLARHKLSLPNPARVDVVRSTLRELAQAELAAGMSQVEDLLTRTDLSTVEREVLESLQAWRRDAPARLAPATTPSASAGAVIDLQAWKARSVKRTPP